MNDLAFVRRVVERLRTARLEVWVFGGWAEELMAMRATGPHADLDLLLLAESFDGVDAFLSNQGDCAEIPDKRFSHKRAFVLEGVRVELFLVRPLLLTSSMFDGRVTVHWPADTFALPLHSNLQVASPAALALYRRDHERVEQAYADYRRAWLVGALAGDREDA